MASNHIPMKTSARILLAVVAVVTLGAIGVGGFYLWQGRFPWEPGTPATLTLPRPETDLAHARAQTVGPKGGLVQVFTDQDVQVTLDIPAGALKEETEVKLIPFAFDPSAQTPTLGVLVSPGSLSFAMSARLTFDVSKSKFHFAAPDAASADTARRSGESQLLHLAGENNVVIPALVVRAVETKTAMTGLVPTGGSYLVGFGVTDRVAYARQGLARTPSRNFVLEAAAFLRANGVTLTKEEQAKASAASRSVLDEKNPRGEEFFAAVAVASAPAKKSAFISVAHAAEINQAFFQKSCADKARTFSDVASLAHAARLLGDASMAKSCWTSAQARAASRARAVLSDSKAELPALLAARTALRVAGGAEAESLEKQLATAATKDVQAEARVILARAKPSAPSVAAVLQSTRVVPVEAPVQKQLETRLQEVAPRISSPTSSGNGSSSSSGGSRTSAPETVSGGQELVSGAEDIVVGYGLAGTLGYDPLTDPSYQAWMNQLLQMTSFPTSSDTADTSEEATSEAGIVDTSSILGFDPTAYLCMLSGMYGTPGNCANTFTDAVEDLQDAEEDEGESDGRLADVPGTEEEEENSGEVPFTDPTDLTWWTSFPWMTDPAYLAALSMGGSEDSGETEEEPSDIAVDEEAEEGGNTSVYPPGYDPYIFLNMFGTGPIWVPPAIDGIEEEEQEDPDPMADDQEEDGVPPIDTSVIFTTPIVPTLPLDDGREEEDESYEEEHADEEDEEYVPLPDPTLFVPPIIIPTVPAIPPSEDDGSEEEEWHEDVPTNDGREEE